MARTAAIAAVVLFLIALPFSGVPFVFEKRQSIAASPSLSGFAANKNIRVRGGERACVSPVPFDRPTQVAQFLIAPQKRGRQSPLEVTASAPGYVSTASLERWTPGAVQFAIAAPRGYAEGQVCLLNRGRRTIELVGTDEPRSQTFAATRVDGKPQTADAALLLLPREQQSLADHFGSLLRRASALTGGLAPAWLLWPIALLAAVALPVGAVTALVLSMRTR
jgi:hypothetical protein